MLDTEPRRPERSPEDLAISKKAAVAEMHAEAKRREDLRRPIEDRMLLDWRQHHGRYDEQTERALKNASDATSKTFVNLTRPKCRKLIGRMVDMLFPTDDRCWSVEPSPDPDLAQEAEDAMERQLAILAEGDALAAASEDGTVPGDVVQRRDEAESKVEMLQAIMDEAKKRARKMERRIDDQLQEGGFKTEARSIIRHGVIAGCGVIKGPVIDPTKARPRWKKEAVKDGKGGGYALQRPGIKDVKPSLQWCDPWGFFPDPTARTMADTEGVYERILMSRSKLSRAGRSGGFDADAVRRILKEGPADQEPTYLTHMRTMRGDTAWESNLYHVWCYSGPMEAQKVADLAEAAGATGMLKDVAERDPLDDAHVVVWFCQNELLSIADYPLDSGEPLYSVFALERDDASVFGYGLPHILREAQGAYNATFRMMADNAGRSAGPQIVMRKGRVIPENGVWEVVANKIWLATADRAPGEGPPFETFDIQMRQPELESILALIRQHVDDESALPEMGFGEPGETPQQTATGTALMMSSANVIFRDHIVQWDEALIEVIGRFIDWNMQADDETVKGDLCAVARGSSVLMVREMQAMTLLALAERLGGHPIFGKFLRDGGLPLIREIFRTHMLQADEHVITDDENKQMQEAPDPMLAIEQEKIALKREEMSVQIAVSEGEWSARKEIATMGRDTAMMQMAEKLNEAEAKRVADMRRQREAGDSKDRTIAVEAAMKQRTGDSSGGYV